MDRYISDKLRQQISKRAGYRCEYCLIPERFLATFFHIDHIRSLKHGGQTTIGNLAYACPHCNHHKGSDVGTFIGDEGDQLVRFFNPRRDSWPDHFNAISGEILPKTPIGEATATILNFNQPERLILRQELALIGQYPG